jgi:hypothetical protein
VRRADNLTTFMYQLTKKSGSLNLLEPSGPVQACNETAFYIYSLLHVDCSCDMQSSGTIFIHFICAFVILVLLLYTYLDVHFRLYPRWSPLNVSRAKRKHRTHLNLISLRKISYYTRFFKMIVGVLTTCHTQYT